MQSDPDRVHRRAGDRDPPGTAHHRGGGERGADCHRGDLQQTDPHAARGDMAGGQRRGGACGLGLRDDHGAGAGTCTGGGVHRQGNSARWKSPSYPESKLLSDHKKNRPLREDAQGAVAMVAAGTLSRQRRSPWFPAPLWVAARLPAPGPNLFWAPHPTPAACP